MRSKFRHTVPRIVKELGGERGCGKWGRRGSWIDYGGCLNRCGDARTHGEHLDRIKGDHPVLESVPLAKVPPRKSREIPLLRRNEKRIAGKRTTPATEGGNIASGNLAAAHRLKRRGLDSARHRPIRGKTLTLMYNAEGWGSEKLEERYVRMASDLRRKQAGFRVADAHVNSLEANSEKNFQRLWKENLARVPVRVLGGERRLPEIERARRAPGGLVRRTLVKA